MGRVVSSSDRESPAIGSGCVQRPEAERVTLTVTVSGLKRGCLYNLYRYDNVDQVPERGFNQRSESCAAVYRFKAQSDTYERKENIKTSEQRIYRCVLA